MKAELFYQTVFEEKVIPIRLMTESEFRDKYDTLPDRVKNIFNTHCFEAGEGQVVIIPDPIGLPELVYVGVGNGTDYGAIAKALSLIPEASYVFEQPISQFAKVVWALAQYRFDRYKSSEPKARILCLDEQEYRQVVGEADAIFYTRDLINMPANDMGPSDLAKALSDLASEFDGQFDQHVGDELLKKNYPAIHAVGRAAEQPPRLLSLTWGKSDHPLITLVGKGVCFDSGGLDIKPANAMRLMKKDMGGAAQAMGLAKWIMSQNLSVRLHVLIPAVENAISRNAFKPGDVLTMRNGLTVEVDNTDAEGRLVLADAMVKACEDEPELLIDFATLTGAARVAVGTEISAMFTADDQLAREIEKAALVVNDPVWRLPLYAGYNSMLDSTIADLVNSSASPFAGAISAALFLQRFIEPQTPWVHFDLMAWNERDKPGKPEGGEAMAIRALAKYLTERYQA